MSKSYRIEYEAFARFLQGRRLTAGQFSVLLFKSFGALLEGFIRFIPGGFGFKLRELYYRPLLKHMGKNVLIDTGVYLTGPANISLGDFVWIDANCILNAYLGEISIGRRVHVAPFTIIGARAPIVLEDYVGLSASVKIYSNTEHPVEGKRMSGPMIPEELKAFKSAPVTLRKDSFVGANSVILPGVELGQGAIVGANAVISKSVAPYDIVVGTGRVVGRREPITVPDL